MIFHEVENSGSATSSSGLIPGHSFGGYGVTQNITPDGGFFILRAPHERKKETKKQEDLAEDQPLPDGQMLQKGEGAQISEDKANDAGGDKATKEGPSLGRTELQKDAKGKVSLGLQTDPVPVHLQGVYNMGSWSWGFSHRGRAAGGGKTLWLRTGSLQSSCYS